MPTPKILTLGGPLPWLHTSLGLGPQLCACVRFPFTNSCSFLSFFCLPASFKIFCTPSVPCPTLLQSLWFLIGSGQLERKEGRGHGPGLGLAQFSLGSLGSWVWPPGSVSRGTTSEKEGFVGHGQGWKPQKGGKKQPGELWGQ